jgi:hypothetical protein
MKIDRCRSCSAEILWVKTLSGKMMPLDVKLAVLYEVEGVDEGGEVTARPVQVRGPHWASCPDAAAWRKPR